MLTAELTTTTNYCTDVRYYASMIAQNSPLTSVSCNAYFIKDLVPFSLFSCTQPQRHLHSVLTMRALLSVT